MIIEINKKIENPDPLFLERLTDADYEYLLSVAIEKLIEALKVCELTECESSRIKLEEYKINYLLLDPRNNYYVDEENDNKNLNDYETYFKKCFIKIS